MNHNKTGGHINLVDETKTNTAYFQNKTTFDQHWDQALSSEQKKDYELFYHNMNEIVAWYYNITKLYTAPPDYSLWHKEF